MTRLTALLILLLFLSCKTATYYVVRHAEKQQGSQSADPPLSAEGEKQALDLKNFLEGKKIKRIYSTNYARTMATAEPIRRALNGEIKLYKPDKLPELIAELKNVSDGNVLVVGHSNTVDDVVNGLTGENKLGDLPEAEYGNVFIITKKGSSYSFERIKLPQTVKR